MNREYDVIVIGCGPAGMTAGIYLARANKKVLILEKETIGGQMASAPLIENYPGYKSILGSELANNMYEQISDLGVDIELEEVKEIKKAEKYEIVTEDSAYIAKSVIIATGSKYRLLGLENESNLIGKGIHFCVACDGAFYKDRVVAVIGGGNSAVINAISLSDICSKVYLIQNLEKLTAEEALVDALNKKNNVEIILGSSVEKIIGDEELEGLTVKTKDGLKNIDLNAMFLSIGLMPQSDIVKDFLELNDYDYILAENGITTLPGLFVAGDCRNKKVRQITVAVSDGTIAALNAIDYLNDLGD